MLTTAIIESGGVLNLPPDVDRRSVMRDPENQYMVQLCVHGLEVTAPTLQEAVKEWIDMAGMTIARNAEAA